MTSLTATRSTTTTPTTAKEHIKVEGDMLLWKISYSKLTVEQAEALATQLRRHVDSGRVSKMLVDNKDLDGVFTKEVNQVWEDLMKYMMSTGHLQKIACISPSVVAKMQVDRLSRQAGTFHFNRAFLNEEDAMAFLG
ncbi:MAG TPA: STAS/SEC14 domain-containing protein [Bacilli bacterium]|nr:STAS/SEC14 domain-containing protein [Bacilli bacterium]